MLASSLVILVVTLALSKEAKELKHRLNFRSVFTFDVRKLIASAPSRTARIKDQFHIMDASSSVISSKLANSYI
jgi:hypothetical protein